MCEDYLCSIVFGATLGSVAGICVGVCVIIRKYYIDLNRHNSDVENITHNILHIDEETGSKIDYMTARPIQ